MISRPLVASVRITAESGRFGVRESNAWDRGFVVSSYESGMTPYGKTAQTAIAAVSRLAEVYDPAKRVKPNSADIAEKRLLPQPIAAKVLTVLSQAGIVNGAAKMFAMTSRLNLKMPYAAPR